MNGTKLFIFCALLWHGVSLAEEPDIAALFRDFSEAEFQIINRFADLPRDVYTTICGESECNIAEFGESWNTTDLIGDELGPLWQHRFSGVSEDFAAVVYQLGGIAGPHTYLYLMRRKSDWACRYSVPPRFSDAHSIASFQWLLSPSPLKSLECHVLKLGGD